MQDVVGSFRERYQRLEALKKELAKAKNDAFGLRIKFNQSLTMPQPGGGRPQESEELKRADKVVTDMANMIDGAGKELENDLSRASNEARRDLIVALETEIDNAHARVPAIYAKIKAALPELAKLVGTSGARNHFNRDSNAGLALCSGVPAEDGLLPALSALRDYLKHDLGKYTNMQSLERSAEFLDRLEAIRVKHGLKAPAPATAA
jgi:hypothetical protein